MLHRARHAEPWWRASRPRCRPTSRSWPNTYATSFDGAQVFADALAYAHLKPSFRGYNEFTTALQDELDSNVFNDNQLTAKAALDEITPR